MALNKVALQTALETGLKNLWAVQSARATQDGEESKDPSVIINQMAADVATLIANAVDVYVKSGDIIVDGTNISGTTSAGPVTFTPLVPAKVS